MLLDVLGNDFSAFPIEVRSGMKLALPTEITDITRPPYNRRVG